jgi:hypothetical protein
VREVRSRSELGRMRQLGHVSVSSFHILVERLVIRTSNQVVSGDYERGSKISCSELTLSAEKGRGLSSEERADLEAFVV